MYLIHISGGKHSEVLGNGGLTSDTKGEIMTLGSALKPYRNRVP